MVDFSWQKNARGANEIGINQRTLRIGTQATQDLGTLAMISSFCSREELEAAMNDEIQPPFAEAELADPDLLPDIPSASVSWMLEYENRLAHVNALVQARQAKAAQAAQPQQAGPKRGRGRPRKNGPLPSPAVLRAAKTAKKRKEREHTARCGYRRGWHPP